MAPHYAYYVREMKIKAYAQVIISTSLYFLLPFDVFFFLLFEVFEILPVPRDKET